MAVPTAAAAILLTLVAGCGHGPTEPGEPRGATLWSPPATRDPGEPRWPGEIRLGEPAGPVEAPGFNTLIDSAAPGWARSPDTAAAELLDLDRQFDGPVKIYLRQETERDEPVVTVTFTRIGDDSVEAMRYRIVFKRGNDGLYRFVSGTKTTRCRSGRGHGTFETGTCS